MTEAAIYGIMVLTIVFTCLVLVWWVYQKFKAYKEDRFNKHYQSRVKNEKTP